MTLVDRNNHILHVQNLDVLEDTATVFNIEVQDSHTYHIGVLGVWVHNAQCCDVTQAIDNTATNTPANSTAKGYTNGTKMDLYGSSIPMSSLTSDQQAMVQDIMANGDQAGTKTEALVNSVANDAGYTVLGDTTYGSNNGFDHVVQSPDGTVTIIIDSKQLNASGGTKLGVLESGDVQLSPAWIENVLNNLPDNSPAKQAVQTALDNQTLKTAIAGLNKSSGELVITPVSIPSVAK